MRSLRLGEVRCPVDSSRTLHPIRNLPTIGSAIGSDIAAGEGGRRTPAGRAEAARDGIRPGPLRAGHARAMRFRLLMLIICTMITSSSAPTNTIDASTFACAGTPLSAET